MFLKVPVALPEPWFDILFVCIHTKILSNLGTAYPWIFYLIRYQARIVYDK